MERKLETLEHQEATDGRAAVIAADNEIFSSVDARFG